MHHSLHLGETAMFDVEFISMGTASVIERKEIVFLFEESDIIMLNSNLYSVIKVKVNSSNGVATGASITVLKIT